MANIEALKASVAKAAEKVEKCKATIERHNVQLGKKLAALQKLNSAITLDNMEDFKWQDTINGRRGHDTYYWPICEVERKLNDIKDGGRNLRAAEETLANWESKLSVAVEKERFLANNAPQVIIDFLNQWKEMAYEWHVQTYTRFVETKADLHKQQIEAMIEAAETLPDFARYLDENGKLQDRYRSEGELINLHPWRVMQEYLKEHKLHRDNIEAKLTLFGPVVARMATYRNEGERLAWLAQVLEEERKAKMLDLINRVNAVVGSITDASGLCINQKGNLDGIVVGTKASARVETIGAGGYNIQCFHYRTLVHEVR